MVVSKCTLSVHVFILESESVFTTRCDHVSDWPRCRPRLRLSEPWTTSPLLFYMSSTPSAIPKSVQNTSFLDLLKPRYHEAVFRLRNTIVALVILFTLTHLLPLPTPYASLWKFYRGSFQSSWERSLAIAGACDSTPTPTND